MYGFVNLAFNDPTKPKRYSFSRDKYLIKFDTINKSKNFLENRTRLDCYATYWIYGRDMEDYFLTQRSVKGFSGPISATFLPLDIDNENLEKALDETRQIIKFLTKNCGIKEEYLLIFFSGNKGFHIYLDSRLLHQSGLASAELNKSYRNFVVNLGMTIGLCKKHNFDRFESLDLSIYDKARVIRLPNSINTKSNLYKVQLKPQQLFDCSIDEIRSYAQSPKETFFADETGYLFRNKLLQVNKELQKFWIKETKKIEKIKKELKEKIETVINEKLRDFGFDDFKRLYSNCKVIKNIIDKSNRGEHLEWNESQALLFTLGFSEKGRKYIHNILNRDKTERRNYDFDTTNYYIENYLRKGYKPATCKWYAENGFCKGECQMPYTKDGRPAISPFIFCFPKDQSENDVQKLVCSEKNLYLAWFRVREYARANDFFYDFDGFECFEKHLASNITILRNQLMSNDYNPRPFRTISIPKREGEPRKLMYPEVRDRVVTMAVLNIIGPLFAKQFSESSFSNKVNLNLESKYIFEKWRDCYRQYCNKLRSFLDYEEYYYLKTDFVSFYDHVQPDILLKKVASGLKKFSRLDNLGFVLKLVEQFTKFQYIDQNGEEKRGHCLPQGPAYGHFLANIYLDDLDKYIEGNPKIIEYARYTDDICLICHPQDLECIKNELNQLLSDPSQFNLEMSMEGPEGKTHCCPISDPQYILEDLQPIKSQLALAFNKALGDSAMEDKLVKIFKEVFIDVPESSDPEWLIKHIGFAIGRMERLKYKKQDVLTLVIDCMKYGPLKASTTKILLGTAIRILFSKDGWKIYKDLFNEYRDYFISQESPDYLKLSLCQLLGLENIENETAQNYACDIIGRYLNDGNYIIQTSALMVLERSPYFRSNRLSIQLSEDNFKKSIVKKAYLLALSRKVDIETFYRYALSTQYTKDETSSEGIIYGLEILRDQKTIELLLPEMVQIKYPFLLPGIVSTIVKKHSESLIKLGLALLQKFPSDILQKLFKLELNSYINTQLQVHAITKLIALSKVFPKFRDITEEFDVLNQVLQESLLRFLPEKNISIELAKSIEQNPTVIKSVLDEKGIHYKFLDRFEIARYENLSNILVVKDIEHANKEVFYENISHNDIEYFFDSVNNFKKWLMDLDNAGVTNLYKTADSLSWWFDYNNSVSILYSPPPGYSCLNLPLEENKFLVIAENLANLGEKMEQTQFVYRNLIPSNILINSSLAVMLINLGSSLHSRPILKYTCLAALKNIGRKCECGDTKEENKLPTAFLFLGYLFFELLTGKCPLKEQKKLSEEKNEKRFLTQSLLLSDKKITPHTKVILRHCITSDNYRYKSFKNIKEDVKKVKTFLQRCQQISDAKMLQWFEFFDFLSYELSRLLRAKGYSHIILHDLFKVAEEFNLKQLNILRPWRYLWRIFSNPIRLNLYNYLHLQKITRQCLELAYIFIVDMNRLKISMDQRLTRLFLEAAVYYELIPIAKFCCKYRWNINSEKLKELLSFIKQTETLIVRIGEQEYSLAQHNIISLNSLLSAVMEGKISMPDQSRKDIRALWAFIILSSCTIKKMNCTNATSIIECQFQPVAQKAVAIAKCLMQDGNILFDALEQLNQNVSSSLSLLDILQLVEDTLIRLSKNTGMKTYSGVLVSKLGEGMMNKVQFRRKFFLTSKDARPYMLESPIVFANKFSLYSKCVVKLSQIDHKIVNISVNADLSSISRLSYFSWLQQKWRMLGETPLRFSTRVRNIVFLICCIIFLPVVIFYVWPSLPPFGKITIGMIISMLFFLLKK